MLNFQGSQGLEDTLGIVNDVTLDEVKHSSEFGGIERAHASATVLDDSLYKQSVFVTFIARAYTLSFQVSLEVIQAHTAI